MSIRDEFHAYLEQRATEISAEPETREQREHRISQSFADAMRDAFNRPRPDLSNLED